MSAPGSSTAPGHTADRQPPGFLEGTWIILRRELEAALDSGVAIGAGTCFLLASSALFMNDFFLVGRADMSAWFARLPLLFVLLVPALGMRTWAEERSKRTFELLATLPLSALQLVLGKYLAVVAILVGCLLGSLPIPVLVCALGEPDIGRIVSGYLASLLLGLSLAAWAGLFSALARDHVLAFTGAALVSFLLLALGDDRVIAVLDGMAPASALGTFCSETLSLLPAFERVSGGWIGPGELLLFGGQAVLAVLATAHVVRHVR